MRPSMCGIRAILWLAAFIYCHHEIETYRVINFIGGIGIPLDDSGFESYISGYILKAQYYLPEEFGPMKLRPQTIHRRRRENSHTEFNYSPKHRSKYINETVQGHTNRKEYKNRIGADSNGSRETLSLMKTTGVYRWIIYRAIEIALNNSALPGQICLLRSICEHAAVPFDYRSGLLGEILHIILTPSTSEDDSTNSSANKVYSEAESQGKSGEDCSILYGECSKPPMEFISAILRN
ncbi:uncharacterized protein LOC131804412 [Musca domestica]|uniref:Uncharacterized protein LOC131804412 n=1 Tax=Musca domestica TaxID=7370 RepID=A0ABM3VBR5_MUSDO|nr:uncharacterized protein LOC131804412 [Musca domestica]